MWGIFKRCGTCNWNSWRRKRKLSRQHIWRNSGQESSKINDRYQTIDPGRSLRGINIRNEQTKNSILRYACSVAQLCLTVCNPMNCIPPGSSVHGIFQARTLEWVAISFYIGMWKWKWSCWVVCDPMDCNLPGSSVHGIFQARRLEWVAISFSRRSSWLTDWTRVSNIVGRRFIIWATREVPLHRYMCI